jgi:IS30 family transposase
MALKPQGNTAKAIGLSLARAPKTITRKLRRKGYRCDGVQVMGRLGIAGKRKPPPAIKEIANYKAQDLNPQKMSSRPGR